MEIKKELLSDYVAMYTAPTNYYFVNRCGQNLGSVIYDSPTVDINKYYKLVMYGENNQELHS